MRLVDRLVSIDNIDFCGHILTAEGQVTKINQLVFLVYFLTTSVRHQKKPVQLLRQPFFPAQRFELIRLCVRL